ncbi:hypothetical protein ACLOJK_008354 [Asimina triloba]
MAIAGLQVKKCRGALAEVSGSLNGLQLGRLGPLSIEKSLAHHILSPGNDAAEIGVGRREAGGLVSQFRCAPYMYGVEAVMVMVMVMMIVIAATACFYLGRNPSGIHGCHRHLSSMAALQLA